MFPLDSDKEDLSIIFEKMKAISGDKEIFGFSKYFDLEGNFEWKRCQLMNFDKEMDMFDIKWAHSDSKKRVTRSNFFYENEDREEFFTMVENAKKWRELCCIYLKYNDLIDRIDTPTNHMLDSTKDKVLTLSLDIPYKYGEPRDPIAVKNMPTHVRYNCSQILDAKPPLNLPGNFDPVKKFDKIKYNLNVVNRVTQEMEHDFTRANHQIEFHLTFPFSKERQQMFQDYFPEDLFLPIADKNRPETDR